MSRKFGERSNFRFKEFGGANAEGKLVTRFNAEIEGHLITVVMKVEPWDTNEEIILKEQLALNELEEKIKTEVARQAEASLGFGYVGG